MPIEHFVAFKFKSEVPETRRETHMVALRELVGQIDAIDALRCGQNFSERAQGFDYGLIVTLADREALKTYLEHPAHQAAAGPLKADCEDVMAVDFEC